MQRRYPVRFHFSTVTFEPILMSTSPVTGTTAARTDERLDRYAARCVNFVLVVTRRAVLAAQARQEILATSQGARQGYQAAEPLGWLEINGRTRMVRSAWRVM